MPKSEESFELPSEPPVFGVIDESPDPEDVIKPTLKKPSQAISGKVGLLPTPDATIGKVPAKKHEAKKPTAAPAGAATAPTIPPAPKTIEQPRAPETTPIKALNTYFGSVKTGTELLQKAVEMTQSNDLKGVISVSKLEKLSKELSQKIIDFFSVVDSWTEGKKSPKEIAQSAEEFISSAKIPSGCQTAFRTIMYFAVKQSREPATETTPASTASRSPLTNAEIIAKGYSSKKATESKGSSPIVETTAPVASTGEKETKSLAERLGFRSRLWNPLRGKESKTAPVVSPTAETTPTTPAAPPPAVESAPAASASTAEVGASSQPPEKPKLDVKIPLMMTRDMEAQLAGRGLTQEEINKLKPEEAWKILNSEKASEEKEIRLPPKPVLIPDREFFVALGEGRIGVTKVKVNKNYLIKGEETLGPLTLFSFAKDDSGKVFAVFKRPEDESEASSQLVELQNLVEPKIEMTGKETLPTERLSGDWTPEKINALTFEEVLKLIGPEDLREILRNTTMDTVSVALTDMPESVKKIRESLTEEDKGRFDRLHGLELLNTQVFIDNARKTLVKIAQEQLRTHLSPEGTEALSRVSEKIAGGGTHEKGETITNAERIGDIFVDFCKGKEEFRLDEFSTALTKAMPTASVKRVYRLTGTHGNYLQEESPTQSSTRFLLVTVGTERYMLPIPVNRERFDGGPAIGQMFPGRPDSLTKLTPAKVISSEGSLLYEEGKSS